MNERHYRPGIVHDSGRNASRAPGTDQGPVLGRSVPGRAAVHHRNGEPTRGASRTFDGAHRRPRETEEHGVHGAVASEDRRDGTLQHRELQVRPARG